MKYYFSNDGDNNNDGLTELTSWQTLGKASSFHFDAGDEILFKRGDIFAGSWSVNDGGTIQNPVIYSTYGEGANPIISEQVNCNDRRNIVFENLHFKGGVGQYSAGFQCRPTWQSPQNITLRNCESSDSEWAGIWFEHTDGFDGTNGITIENCYIHDNAVVGIFLNGQDATHRFINIELKNNRVLNNGNLETGEHGVWLRFCEAPIVNENNISFNKGYLDWSSGLYFDSSPNSSVLFNTMNGNTKTNYHFDVNSNGFVCKYNLSSNAQWQGYWIEEHLRVNGASHLENNISLNDGRGIYFGPGGTFFVVSGVTVKYNSIIEPLYSCIGIDNGMGGVTEDNFDNDVDYNIYKVTGSVPIFATVSPDKIYNHLRWTSLTGFDSHSLCI